MSSPYMDIDRYFELRAFSLDYHRCIRSNNNICEGYKWTMGATFRKGPRMQIKVSYFDNHIIQ